MILVMEPMTIVGAVFGGILNKLLPVWLTTVLLTALLSIMAQKLWLKAATMYKKESEALRQRALRAVPEDVEAANGVSSQAVRSPPPYPRPLLHIHKAVLYAYKVYIYYTILSYFYTRIIRSVT
jgi:putative Ca2+/H+ antiporter (TMEM165/GDT1 family)